MDERVGGGRHGARWAAATIALALLFAVGSTVALASIPGSDGLISGCYAKVGGDLRVIDASSSSCKSNEIEIEWNQQGPRGPQGEPGLEGEQGPPGLSGYEMVDTATANVDPLDYAQITAYCPTGKNVLGGGFFINVLGTLEVVESAPTTAAGLSGWHVVAFNHSATVTGNLIAYATCAYTS
jgi:hypothetical protein